MKQRKYCTRVHALASSGQKVFPYTGIRGAKAGKFSVSFTSRTTDFEGLAEDELIAAIQNGRFKDRGVIRMLPIGADMAKGNNAFAPRFLDGKSIYRSR